MEIKENVSLASLTTFGVGGTARYVLSGTTVEDIQAAKKYTDDALLPFIVLGGGSNMLPDDGIIDAVFYSHKQFGIDIKKEGDRYVVEAAAGERWDDVVAAVVEAGLYGVENLSGIPGTMGGACVQNIGAYGAALSSVIQTVEVFDLKEGRVRTLSQIDCTFGYRNSIFKSDAGRYVILRAFLSLSTTGTLDISYRDLAEAFKDKNPTLPLLRTEVLSIRSRKFPDLSVEGTAGSFFKNPIVSRKEAEELKIRFPGIPLYIIPEQRGVKVPLAWLMDNILKLRGYTIGLVRCFETQPLVLVAKRGATASEVRALARHVITHMQNEIGIRIEPEVCVMEKNVFVPTINVNNK